MTNFKTLIASAAVVLGGQAAMAGSDLDAALKDGGVVLTSNEIAELVVGKAVSATAGEKEFRFYYTADNVVDGELANGGWKGSGAYAITDNNQICVSMAADKGRYRCLTVVRNGDVVQKFNVAGKMTFELGEIAPAEGL